MAKKKKKDVNDGEFTHNPFAALAGLSLPDADPDVLDAMSAEAAAEIKLSPLALRKEKKGRRGKTVTCITGARDWPEEERTVFMKKIKNVLGTGASFDGEDIVVQGEHIERLKKLFEKENLSFT